MKLESALQSEDFITGQIEGVVTRELRRFNDKRGWLTELFRHDELAADVFPTMAYISATKPGITRGPHEHVDQADLFCFLGPSNFKLRMWDNRHSSRTFNHVMTLVVGADDPNHFETSRTSTKDAEPLPFALKMPVRVRAARAARQDSR